MFKVLFKEIEIDSLLGLKAKKARKRAAVVQSQPEQEFSLSELDALRVPILTSEVKRFKTKEEAPAKKMSAERITKQEPEETIQYDRGIDFVSTECALADSAFTEKRVAEARAPKKNVSEEKRPQEKVPVLTVSESKAVETPAIAQKASDKSVDIPVLTQLAAVPSNNPRIAVYGSQGDFFSGVGRQLQSFSQEFDFINFSPENLEEGIEDELLVAWIVRLSEVEEDLKAIDELERIEHPQVLYVLEDIFDEGGLEKCYAFLTKAAEEFVPVSAGSDAVEQVA